MKLMIAALVVCCYLIPAWQIFRALRQGQRPNQKIIWFGLFAVIGHGVVLSSTLYGEHVFHLGFFNTLSLVFWSISLLLLMLSLRLPLINLAVVIFPLSALSLVTQLLSPSSGTSGLAPAGMLDLHIALSVLAYSILTIAVIQAIFLALQHKYLHSHRLVGFVQAMPPLETMETLLFQLISLGFILQSLSLLSGVIFLDNIFAQHIAHKTLLSLLAWAVFAQLLWGHWRLGWRGKTAVRWTLGGFSILLFAFLGSKLILELLASA